jgi:hypothetical protein
MFHYIGTVIKSRHVSGITCPSLGDTTRMQLWWLLCSEIYNKLLSRWIYIASYYMYTIYSVRLKLHWVGYEWIRECSNFLYVPVVDVCWSQDLGRLLFEGESVLSVSEFWITVSTFPHSKEKCWFSMRISVLVLEKIKGRNLFSWSRSMGPIFIFNIRRSFSHSPDLPSLAYKWN